MAKVQCVRSRIILAEPQNRIAILTAPPGSNRSDQHVYTSVLLRSRSSLAGAASFCRLPESKPNQYGAAPQFWI
jgi:hypothetical protein